MNISSFYQEFYQWRRYGVAVLAVAIALGVKLLLNTVIENESPFLTFFVAILVSVRYGGTGAGLLATFLAASLSDYFFLIPTHSFASRDLGQNLQLFLFVVEGISMSSIVVSLNSANQQVEASKLEELHHEESLHQCEERFCLLVEDVKDYAIFMISNDGHIASWNAGGENIFGYPEADIIGQDLSCIFTSKDIQSGQPKRELQTAMALGQAYEECQHIRANGTIFWASGVVTALRDEAGNMRGFSKVVRDITERKQAEKALQEANYKLEVKVEHRTTELRNTNKYLQSEIVERQRIESALQKEQEFLKVLLNNIEAGIVACDAEGVLTLFNQSTQKFYSLPEQLLPADQWAQHYELYLPGGETPLKKEDTPLVRALQGEHVSNVEIMLVPKHGKQDFGGSPPSEMRTARTLLTSGQALFDPQGKKLGAVVVMHDITKRLRSEEALRQSEERFRLLIENVKDYAIFMINTDGYIVSWNAGVERIFGYQESEIIGKHFSYIFTPEDIQSGEPEQELSTAVATEQADDERWHICKNGTFFWASGVVTTLRDDAGNPRGFIKVVRDMTERKRVEDALRQSEARLRLAIQVNQAGTWDWDMVTNKIIWCPDHEQLFGLTPGTFDGTHETILKCIHPEDRQVVSQALARAIESRTDYDQEYRVIWLDGSIRWLAVKGKVFYGGTDQAVRMVGLSVDTTNLKRTAKQIAASLQEKEVLLKEIHHRVKNNLQIISSLLNLQAGYIEDQKTIEILKQCENRVASMALIHEQLYQSHDLARIEFAEYVKTLTANLLSSYGIHSGAIALKVDVNNILLSIDAAIPCGLLINELVSNSLKHAFSPGEKGEICIGLHTDDNNHITLSISDDGIGFPENLDFKNTESLGLQIVIALTNQLEGTIELNRNNGTEFKIKFY